MNKNKIRKDNKYVPGSFSIDESLESVFSFVKFDSFIASIKSVVIILLTISAELFIFISELFSFVSFRDKNLE